MKTNEGIIDRIIRIILGILIAGLGIYFKNWLGLIAIVPLATGIIGLCPIYMIFGLSTCKTKKSDRS